MLKSLFLIGILLLCYRIYAALGKQPVKRRRKDEKCAIAIFLGSGGHTAEMITMLSSLDFDRYQPRLYIVGSGDHLSETKVHALEDSKNSKKENYRIIVVPRARKVHQSLLATPPTALWSFLYCFWLVLEAPLSRGKPVSDLILFNGPGTCSILCLSIFICRIFALPTPRVIYIESFTRVKGLSLSGKLVLPFVDRFVVQWPELLKKVPSAVYKGWLV